MWVYPYDYTFPNGVEQQGVFAGKDLTHAVVIHAGGGWRVWSAYYDEGSAREGIRNVVWASGDQATVIPIAQVEL
jgi:hypothetical protein